MEAMQSLFEEAQKYIPGGVNSPVRAFKAVGGTTVYVQRAQGAYIFDTNDKKYIDYIGSWGPMILGHANPEVIKAVQDAAPQGLSFGCPTTKETELAKLVCNIVPSIEKIRMVSSGTEATMSAIRLARGFTGKNKIIKFDGCYHGHVDSLLIKAGSGVSTFGLPDSPGIPEELAKLTITCPYNDVEAFTKIFNSTKDDLAAIIVEPIAGNMGFVPGTDEFLNTLRDCATSNNSLLIFDEVMSGFRVSLGGAQEIYGITPDLTALGKVIGGGLPVGAFGGKKEIMEYLAPEGPVYQAGTLSGNPLAMAAGSALLRLIIDENPYKSLENKAKTMLLGIQKLMFSAGIPFSTNQIGGMFGFFFLESLPQNIQDVSKSNDKMFCSFLNAAISNGIYFAPSKFEAGFISYKHGDKEIDKTLEIVEKIIKNGDIKK